MTNTHPAAIRGPSRPKVKPPELSQREALQQVLRDAERIGSATSSPKVHAECARLKANATAQLRALSLMSAPAWFNEHFEASADDPQAVFYRLVCNGGAPSASGEYPVMPLRIAASSIAWPIAARMVRPPRFSLLDGTPPPQHAVVWFAIFDLRTGETRHEVLSLDPDRDLAYVGQVIDGLGCGIDLDPDRRVANGEALIHWLDAERSDAIIAEVRGFIAGRDVPLLDAIEGGKLLDAARDLVGAYRAREGAAGDAECYLRGVVEEVRALYERPMTLKVAPTLH